MHLQLITHTKGRRTKASTRRRLITTGGASGNRSNVATISKIKPLTKQKTTDPASEYQAQVKSLEAAIKAAQGSEALKAAIPNHQLKLARVHRDYVTNDLGFRPDLAKLGFFVAGPNEPQRSLEGRRIWEAADALERAARANNRRKQDSL